MMKNKNWRLVGLLAILAALIIFLVKIRISEAPTTNSSQTETNIESELIDDGVIFATTADNQNLYINTKYGFSFVYPEGWRTGDYSSESLQLMNYPEKDALHSSSVFGKGENKIGMSVNDKNSDFYRNTLKSTSTTEIQMGAQDPMYKWVDGNKFVGYFIPLQNEPDKFIGITMYGDTINWNILDELVKKFSWTKK